MIIGIVGQKRVGKNTVATILCNLQDKSIPEILNLIQRDVIPENNFAFATRLKLAACDILGCTLKELDTLKESTIKGLNITYRQFLQLLGTEIGQKIDRHIWVNGTLSDIDKFEKKFPNYDIITISDVRFQHEADAILETGGLLLGVKRNTGLQDSHISESGVDDIECDAYIFNDGTIMQLISSISDFYIKYCI